MQWRLIAILAQHTCLEVLRSKIFLSLLIGSFILVSFVLFIGQLAITERIAIQVALMASIIRMGSVLLLALIVIASMAREQQDKQLEMVLSLPLNRASYYLGKWSGFAAVTLVVVVCISTPIAFFINPGSVLFWALSLFLELLVIVSVSLFFQMTFRHVPASMLSLIGFYALSRSVSALSLIAQNPIAPSQDFSQVFMVKLINLISYLLPHLSDFTQSNWLIERGSAVSIAVLVQQIFTFIVLVMLATLVDFYRKKIL